MGNKFLKTRLKRIYPLLVLEDVISHETRVFLKKILGAVALLFFVAALFYKGEYLSQVKGAFSLFGFLWLWLILIEAYFYSHYENAKNMDKKVPFEIARLLYYSEEGDLTKGFLFSDLGDEVMKRLEFDEKEIKEFLHDRESVLLSLENLLTDDFDFKEYIESVYESDEALQALLMKKNLQFKDFLGAFLWVLQKFEDRIEQERFWSLERLSRIEGIGKNWSYGETYVLDRYGEDVTERGSSHLEGYQSMHTETVAKLESVLCKSHGANALVVSEDEASRMDIVTMLARQIKDGEALAPLAKERVYVINTNLLIEGASDKISFEREFQNVLVQAMKALNVIVVIPYFSVFLKSAETLGSDALSIMRPFFLSPVLHIIALDSKEAYQNHLSQNSSIMENFEVIHAELSDERGALIMLQEEAQKIESESRFFFSYPALVAICEGAKRYFDAYSFADKARDLLLEAVPFAATKGSHRICRSHISALIESKTGVPTEAPKGKEKEMLLNLEEMLHSRVVGQDEAVKAISAALKRSRAGVRNPDKPIGSFLFLGPTGVGKTETTKALADIFFGSEEKISRLDMSEYQGADSLEKLIGYFGREEQGLLVSKLRERPYGVVLLDEFEKTNTSVMNVFLSILDEGQFSDATGKKVNAKNNIFIATSNAGSDLIWNLFERKENPSEHKDEIINAIIADGTFRPELLNRFDGVILFHPLDSTHLEKIATFMINKLAKRMKEKSVILETTPDLIKYLVEKGTDPKFGARPMNRAIQNEVEQLIAEKIIAGDIVAGSKVSFALSEDNMLKVSVR